MDDEASTNNPDAEAIEYFSDAKKLECLRKYPTVKEVFLKYQGRRKQFFSGQANQLQNCVYTESRVMIKWL